MKATVYTIILCLIPGSLFAAEFPEPVYKTVVPGVLYGQVKQKDPLISYHVVKVDTHNKNIKIRPIRSRTHETLGQMSKRLLAEGVPLLGAITGDYYHYNSEYDLTLPWGILVQRGELLFSPTGKSALVMDAQEVPRICLPEMKASIYQSDDSSGITVLAVNRQVEFQGDGCCLYTPAWGTSAPEIPEGFAVTVKRDSVIRVDKSIQGKVVGFNRMPVRALIPGDGFVLVMEKLSILDQPWMKLGNPVTLKLDLSPVSEEVIGGGPRLLRDGRVSVEMSQENFGRGKAAYLRRGRHPRSAVGISSGGEILFLVVVEGRSRDSRGMNMDELAELMLSLGARAAMAFDGGRSVGMFVGGREAVTGHRGMADALGVFAVEKADK